MARKDPDCWAAWQEDSFKLDADSPLAISRSLWDEFSNSDTDSCTLFTSTPATDITEAGAIISSLSHQAHIPCDVDQDPRQKRRRMLFFSHEGPSLRDYEIPEDQDVFERGELTIAGSVAEESTWYINPEDEHPEQPAECWMETCFNDSDDQPTKLVDASCSKVQVPVCQTASEISDGLQVNSNGDPVTPVSSRRSSGFGRKKHGMLNQQQKSPVAYPFALLKPCGATGDVTLSDLNQRIQTPRAKPMQQLSGELGENLGAGLSGKSVVALTKIHTEGNGSITIMRTKG